MPEFAKTVLQMGTIVHLRVLADVDEREAQDALTRAQEAMAHVEAACSRFDPASELRQLSAAHGRPTPVSEVLFGPLQFALTIADETDGLFDPTIGRILHQKGFSRLYTTGEAVLDDGGSPGEVTYRDVVLDPASRTVTLLRPMTLDLGAVAKGFAIDLAAQVLKPYVNFLIDAGGDIFAGGRNAANQPWQVGIRHPVYKDQLIGRLSASDMAICTSGGYERTLPDKPGEHHVINPRTGHSPTGVLSSTVVAPYAMMADGFSTVAFLSGVPDGLVRMEQFGVECMLIDDALDIHRTEGMKPYVYE